jgi:hypothetical protein
VSSSGGETWAQGGGETGCRAVPALTSDGIAMRGRAGSTGKQIKIRLIFVTNTAEKEEEIIFFSGVYCKMELYYVSTVFLDRKE